MEAMISAGEQLEIEQPPWRSIPPELRDGLTSGVLSRKRARTWSLVLQARAVPFRLEPQGRNWQLLVPVDRYAAALKELRTYEEKNRNWPPPLPKQLERPDNSTPVIAVLLLLAVFHHLTLLSAGLFGSQSIDWLAIGNADAGRIIQGEWWRLLTALTLHSGWLHLLSNLCIGSLFIVRLCRDFGAGLGWSLPLVSGLLGNLANAFLQPPEHRSIGASTAVFGVVGALAAISLLRFRLPLYRRWPLPVAAGLGLLALLGAAGENTDLGAHLFGFCVGLALGLVTEFLVGHYGRPGKGLNRLLAIGCAVLLVWSWRMAIIAG